MDASLNEDGLAVRNCYVQACNPDISKANAVLTSVAGGTGTDDKGEYRISGLAPGRYYLFAHCRAELPAPHPLLPRGDPRTPYETYVPQFYGGGSRSRHRHQGGGGRRRKSGRHRFRDAPHPGLHAARERHNRGSRRAARQRNVMLYPANPLMQDLMQFGATTKLPQPHVSDPFGDSRLLSSGCVQQARGAARIRGADGGDRSLAARAR